MENLNVLLDPVRAFLLQIGTYLPRVAVAVAVLLAGWLIAKVVRLAIVRALRAINFKVLTERAGIDGFLAQGGIEQDTTGLIGSIFYWLVIFGALLIASNGLGLSYVSDLLDRVLLFLPRVFVALLVLTFGAYFARFVGGTVMAYCSNVGIRDADLLGRLAQYAILAFVILITLEQLDIGGDILRHAFLIVLSGVVLAFALAFGLGGREWAGAMLQRWWPTRHSEAEEPPAAAPPRRHLSQR